MRVVLLTVDSSRVLVELCEKGVEVLGVVRLKGQRPVRRTRWFRRWLGELRWALRTRLYPRLDLLDNAAWLYDVPVIWTWTVGDPDLRRRLADLHPDFLVVAGFPQRIPRSVAAIPRYACLNIHASLLPQYRGPQPTAQAIVHGEPVTGVTVHRIARDLDAGDVLAQQRIPIRAHDTVFTLAARQFGEGARLAVGVMGDIAAGRAGGVPQAAEEATYYGRIERTDLRIDWAEPAHRLHNLVRLHPWRTAFTDLEGRELLVERSSVEPGLSCPPDAAPGTVLGRGPDGWMVATGSGVLRLERVRWAHRWPPKGLGALAPGRVLGRLGGCQAPPH